MLGDVLGGGLSGVLGGVAVWAARAVRWSATRGRRAPAVVCAAAASLAVRWAAEAGRLVGIASAALPAAS